MKPIKIDIKSHLRDYKTAGSLARFARIDDARTPYALEKQRAWSNAVDSLRATAQALQAAMNPILAEEEARCRVRTLSADTALRACREAEEHLDDMGIGKAERVGAVLYITPGAETFPRGYLRKGNSVGFTAATAERRALGWYITRIYRDSAWAGNGVPSSFLGLTSEQQLTASNTLLARACTLS